MGVLSAVFGVFSGKGHVVDVDEIPAAGEARTVTTALIAALRATKPEEIRRESTVEYLNMVIQGHRLEEYCETLAALFGEPRKPFGVNAKLEGPLGELIDEIGGITKTQCLYLRRFADDHVAYAAIWPWADPAAITLKVGVFARALPAGGA